jgi:hypothetical protein
MRRFRVADVIGEALRLVADRRRALLHALILPGASVVALTALEDDAIRLESVAVGIHVAVQTIVYSVFAVVCHRILLLGDPALPNRWGVFLTAREGRFIGWSIVTALMTLPVFFLGSMTFISVFHEFVQPLLRLDVTSEQLSVVAIVAGAPGWYILARSSLVLPATAIDFRPTMARAWRLSHANGWRLTLALVVPFVFFWGVAWLIDRAVGESHAYLLHALVAPFALCLEVAVLSVSFRVLDEAQEDQVAA